MAAAKNAEKAPITIKKSANRRLYNTATSKYVTLNDLAQMVKAANVFSSMTLRAVTTSRAKC